MAGRKSGEIRRLVYAAVCLALCLTLPYLTGSVPQIGKGFAPMHLPVFLCGFIAGPVWGGIVGITAPFLRFLIAGAPALYPQAVRMAAELGVYGIAAGLFYRYLPRKPLGIITSLLCAQFFGRLAWGAAQFFISLVDPSNAFYLEMIVTQTVSNSLYGIVIQLVLIPPIVYTLQRKQLISRY